MRLKKGLRLPLAGPPRQEISPTPLSCQHVGVVGPDFQGLRPSMLVKEGDRVKAWAPLFTCKKTPGLLYTAPASGKVVAVARGPKRAFQYLAIAVEGGARQAFSQRDPEKLMVESGLWTAFRTRPFSRPPPPGQRPHSLFVVAMDTNPLAADPSVVIRAYEEFFHEGLEALRKIFQDQTIWLCTALPIKEEGNLKVRFFQGPHPAGNVGTHMHFLDPVVEGKVHWHIGYQDVISLGFLIKHGHPWGERVVALGGPPVKDPRLVKVPLGANLNEALSTGPGVRTISGPVFHGRTVDSSFPFLGRYHVQISVVEESHKREFLGWHTPGVDRFSLKNIYLSKFLPKRFIKFTTALHGSLRALVPVGGYEQVMPMNLLATPLLRALLTKDTDQAQSLGCLELDEEDLALCTFVCPSKIDYGPLLREVLSTIEREG